MAYTSAGLFEDPRREEAGGSTTKTGEHKAQQRTVTGGPGVVVGSSDELSRWTATRSPIEGGQTEEIDYHGFEEAYRANDQGEERSGLDEGSTCAAQGSLDKTRAKPGGKYEGTAAAVSVGVGQFRCLRSRAGAELRCSKTCHTGHYATNYACGGGRQGDCRARFSFAGWRTWSTHRSRGRGRSERREHGHQHERGHAVTEYFGCVCELFDGVTYSVRSSTVQITKRRWYSQGFLRRGGGVGLTWQSVFTEQDQTRSLRFRDDVEVFEFRVGYDMDHWRYNIYDHYEFYWTTLAVAKPTLGVNSWNGMTTAEALLHCYNHSVRSNDNFLDEWVAIERASALRGELISGEHGKIDDGQLAVSVDHDGTPGKPFDQPGQGEVPDRIPVVSTGLHDEDEETTFEVSEEDIFEHLHGGVHAVHHLESAQDATNDQPLTVITFGLSGEGRGRRDFYSDTGLRDVWQGVRQVWADFDDFDLYYVEPQPVMTRWPYIVFIVEESNRRSSGQVPVLLNFRQPSDMYNILWDLQTRAGYFNVGFTVIDNLAELGVEDVCQPDGLRICRVNFGLDQVALHDRPAYRNGALCDVDIGDFPQEWSAPLAVLPNFEQFASTILMLRREGGLSSDHLSCCLHEICRDGETQQHHFRLPWTISQHPGLLVNALREQGVDCELIAMVWPQPQHRGGTDAHVWRFVGGPKPQDPSSLNMAVICQRGDGQTLLQPFVNNPETSVDELLDSLQLPGWCTEGGGLDRYRVRGNPNRRVAHGRRIDFVVDNEAEEAVSLTQLKVTPLSNRGDDGEPGIEEIIEHYQTQSPDEEESGEEDSDRDYEDGASHREGDPPEHPDPPDEDMPQEASSDSEWVHGMIFRKGHPVANVWVHQESYDEMVTEVAGQLSMQPRDILGIHYLNPEPFDRPHVGFAALARCRGDQYPDTTECLVLVDVFIYNRANVPQEPALFRNVIDLPPLLTRRQLLERTGLEPMCRARRDRCLVKVEGRSIPLQHTGPIFIQHASYVVIRIPPFEDDDFGCEPMSLVQTRATMIKTREGRVHLHLFRRGGQHRRLQVRERSEERPWLIDDLSEREDEIVQGLRVLHEVQEPPRDLELTRETVFIGEGWGERGSACHREDTLILTDIEIKQSARHWDSHTIRKVIWCRAKITRTSLLTALRIHYQCLGDDLHGCHVFLNHLRIEDEVIRHTHDGDYLRVVIFGKDRPNSTLRICQTVEENDRQNRVFGDTSEEGPRNFPSSSTASHSHVLDRWCSDSSGGVAGS